MAEKLTLEFISFLRTSKCGINITNLINAIIYTYALNAVL